MTLRVSLQIDGDASGAAKAAAAAAEGIEKVGAAARGAVPANDNAAQKVAALAQSFGELAAKGVGAESALAKSVAVVGNLVSQYGQLSRVAGIFPAIAGGIGLAATAAVSLYDVVTNRGREAETRTNEHARLIGLVRDAYGDAANKAGDFYRQSAALTQLQLVNEQERLQGQFRSEIGSAISGATTFANVGDYLNQVKQVRQEFAAFEDPIFALKDGTITVKEFGEQLGLLALRNPELRKAATELANLASTAAETELKLGENAAAQRRVQGLPPVRGDDRRLGISGGAAQQANDVDRLAKSLERQIAAQEAQAAAVGKSVGESAKLRAQFLLLEAAQQAGIDVTGKYAERIETLASRFGDAAQRAAELQLRSDLNFEREQLGRGGIDAEVADRLRGVFGDRAGSMFDSEVAGAIRFNAQMRELKGLTQEFAGGLLSDFRSQLAQGADAWEAFENAGLNALSRLADRLLDSALQNDISRLFGAFTGNLFGGGGGGTGFTLAGLSGLYDVGGYTGDGGRYHPAGVVHRGEYVFDAVATRNAGVPFLEAMHRNLRGYADGGFVGAGAPMAPGAGGPQIDLSDHRTITINGGGDIEEIKAELARDRADRKAQTIDIVRRAFKSRELRR